MGIVSDLEENIGNSGGALLKNSESSMLFKVPGMIRQSFVQVVVKCNCQHGYYIK